jgi:hypothetical protein
MTSQVLADGAKGSLSVDGKSFEVEFQVARRTSGKVNAFISPISVGADELVAILDSEKQTKISLSGTTDCGTHVKLSDCFVRSSEVRGSASDRSVSLSVTAHVTQIGSIESTLDQHSMARYWIPALPRLNGDASSSDCEYALRGITDEEREHQLFGYLGLRPLNLTKIADLDRRANRLIEFLSFACGAWLRYNTKDIVCRSEVVMREFLGGSRLSVGGPPVFDLKTSGSLVKFAVKSYTDEVCESTGIDVAIEWTLMNPTYAEADLLCLCTALEHIVDTHRDRLGLCLHIPKEIFRKQVRPAIDAAIESSMSGNASIDAGSLGEAIDALTQAASHLNSSSFRSSLLSLCSHYKVPLNSLGKNIAALVQLRNGIVHRGYKSIEQFPNDMDFYSRQARELVVRIILSILKYQGPYYSQLGDKVLLDFQSDTSGLAR